MTTHKDIKTWQERLPNTHVATQIERGKARDAEISDLRAYAEQVERERDALREQLVMKPTDLSRRLRAESQDGFPYFCCSVDKKLLRDAADEIERYYTGMCNWKATAEAKDAAFAAQYQSPQPVGAVVADERAAFEKWCGHHGFDTQTFKDSNGTHYELIGTRAYWIGWDARAALAAQAPAPPTVSQARDQQGDADTCQYRSVYLQRAFEDRELLKAALAKQGEAKPLTTIPAGLQALADYTGSTVMYGDHAVMPRKVPEAQAVDAARLDWLESECCCIGDGYIRLEGNIYCESKGKYNLREAIDAALAKQGEANG